MKQHPQPSRQQPNTGTIRKPAQELPEEQLKQVMGGLPPQPLPPGMQRPPDHPSPRLTDDERVLSQERRWACAPGASHAATSRPNAGMESWYSLQTRRALLSPTWRVLAFVVSLLMLASCASSTAHSTATPGKTATAAPQSASPFTPGPGAEQMLSNCTYAVGLCLSPEQVQRFYDLNPLYAKGYTGKGETIIILDSYGSPTITQDLHQFDQTFGLPDPPAFAVEYPLGPVNLEQHTRDEYSWEYESTLDVDWAHAIAPGANIVQLVSPVDETEGVQGFPQFEQLATYAMDHQLGQVISESFLASEPTLVGDPCKEDLGSGQALLKAYDQTVYQRAVTEQITVLAGAGDDGATDPDCSQQTPYPFQNVGWPASDPLVTAVGGTQPTLQDDAGEYGGESVWNGFEGFSGAGGGGLSQFYAEPEWQQSLPNQGALHGKRAIPDVSWDAAMNFPVYESFSTSAAWVPDGGTSAATAQWAGLIAIADQMAAKPLGFLNPALYALAGKGFHDITSGNNSFNNVPGFQADPGWDLATGWGTPDAAVLLPQLIAAVEQMGS